MRLERHVIDTSASSFAHSVCQGDRNSRGPSTDVDDQEALALSRRNVPCPLVNSSKDLSMTPQVCEGVMRRVTIGRVQVQLPTAVRRASGVSLPLRDLSQPLL